MFAEMLADAISKTITYETAVTMQQATDLASSQRLSSLSRITGRAWLKEDVARLLGETGAQLARVEAQPLQGGRSVTL